LFAVGCAALTGCASSAGPPHEPDLHAPVPHDAMMTPADLSASVDLRPEPDLQPPNIDMAMCPKCDDNIACTVDVCIDATDCGHYLDHGKCQDTELCTPTNGCVNYKGTKVCSLCASDSDCSDGEICGTGPDRDGGTNKFCLPTCASGGSCPKGFTCETGMAPPRCVPQTLCCIDNDSDQHGFGAGCLGIDCDDHDPYVYDGHPEICDGKDNNCNGTIDEGYLCAAPMCTQIGTSGLYQATPIGTCNLGNCSDDQPQPCGKYTCMSVTSPMAGTVCRTSCSGADDSACIASAYCDGAACSDRLPDGSACGRNRACLSNHCQNGHCCGAGDCCAIPGDCPDSYQSAPSCDGPTLTNCQGHRVDKTCVVSVCGSTNVPDDSSCTSAITLDCSAYGTLNQHCSGASVQSALGCLTSCASDAGCATGKWCKNPGANGQCVDKQPDGSACPTGAHECVHNCLNGFCCNAGSGACCSQASDCPANYALAPTCVGPLTNCQGYRYDKACPASKICGSTYADDDRACGSSISMSCGNYLPVTCNGAIAQNPLSCPTSCSSSSQCITDRTCFNGQCVPWVENGGGCWSNLQCRSANCVRGICCNSTCNNTDCDDCSTGSCNYFYDYWETGPYCGSGRTVGSGAFDYSLSAYIENYNDNEDWYWLYATDGNNACFWPFNDYGHLIVTLNVPAGHDYDLYLYKWHTSCSDLELKGSSTNGTGIQDRVDFQEDCGGDDTAWYLVKVIRYYTSPPGCSTPYGLSISAHL
jgi:hypothetical protein